MIRKVAPHTTFSSPLYQTSAKHGKYEVGYYDEKVSSTTSRILMTKRTPEQATGGYAGVDSCASHSPLPNSVFENIAHLNPAGVYTPDCPIRFGTVSTNQEDDACPTSTTKTEQFFHINGDESVVYVQDFAVVDKGTIASFPVLLGGDFFRKYGLVISYKDEPPTVEVAGTKYLLAEEPIAMVKILFIPREVAQGRWQPPALRPALSKQAGVADFVAGTIALMKGKMCNWAKPKVAKEQRSPAAGTILMVVRDDDEDVYLEAINQAEQAGRRRSSSRASTESTRTGTTVGPDVDQEELQRHRDLYQWMKNEHRQMGHSPAAEMLYKGEALKALQQVRKDCRLCGQFDNAEQVRKRGGLQQFAYDRNLKWLFDMIYTRIGRLLKILDCCTRLRCYELVDDRDGDGAAVTAAVRCYQRAKRQMGGKPREVFWDLGSEFLSWRLRKVLESGNVVIHDIGFKSAHRISKLEVSNREDKRRINKLTHAPFEPFLELMAWGLAQQKVEEELFNFPYQQIVDEICSIESDSGEHRDHFEAKQQIAYEMEFQGNNTPMLNTTITPFNAHYGTFDRGTRDWEDLWESMEEVHGLDPLPKKSLLTADQLLGGERSDGSDSDESSSEPAARKKKMHGADIFMRRNERIQHVCRLIVLDKDIENFGRRREIVGRVYKRGNKDHHFQIEQRVFVRRPITKKFLRWVGGTVKGVNEEDRTVDVQVGARTQAYAYTDVAHIEPLLSSDGSYEFYPDKHLLELVEDRGGVVVFDEPSDDGTICREVETDMAEKADLFTRRADVFSSVRDGQSTQRVGVVGSVDSKYTCELCKRSYTSLRRFLQHSAKCPGKLSNYRRGVRTSVSFDASPPDLSLGPKHVWRQDLRPRNSSMSSGGSGSNSWAQSSIPQQPSSVEEQGPQGSPSLGSLEEEAAPTAEELKNMPGKNVSNVLGRLGAFDDLSSDDDIPQAPPVEVRQHPAYRSVKHLPADYRAEATAQISERALRHQKRQETLRRLDQKNIVRKRGAALKQWDDEPELLDAQALKRARADLCSEFWCYTSIGYEKKEDVREVAVGLDQTDRLLNHGHVHEILLHAMQQCETEMQLVIRNGKAFLTPDVNTPDSDVVRSVDFSVLPQLEKLIGPERKASSYKLLEGKNTVLFMLSQLMNGKPIRDKLNFKDNRRDIRYVVVSAHFQPDRIKGDLPPGKLTFLRWGPTMTPQFQSEEAARRAHADTWVVAIYFEVTTEAHEALEKFGADCKSSAVIVTIEDAAKLNFLCYVFPALVQEIASVWGHKIFGREGDLAKLKREKKNVVTSRFVITIKIDRFTGEVQKVKGRWVTQGFRDDRFKRPQKSDLPPSRSHTVADSTVLLLCQFLQSTRSAGMLADIKEAFLRGKRMIDLYDRPEDIEIWCKIPDFMQQLDVPGVPFLGQVRLLDKALYGQCDAPAAWETTLWDTAEQVGLLQSYVDPSLWLYYANSAERRILAAGEEVTKKYYRDKVREISAIPRDQLRNRVLALEAGAEKEQKVLREWTRDTQLINPQSVRFCEKLLPHFQYEQLPEGAFGVHVDDVFEGGSLVWHLRMFALFDSFELGSFCILQPCQRDAYIGRELALVPMAYDQQRVRDHLAKNQHHMQQADLTFPEGALEEVKQEELDRLFVATGVKHDVLPEHYPETEKISYDPEVVLQLYRTQERVVYSVGQEVYASKIAPLERAEVEKYFAARIEAGNNKFKQKQNKSPFRGRLGELIWLKSNAIVSEGVSELASLAHEAEKCVEFEEVQGFVEDMNGVIGVAKFREANTKRIYFLGGPGEMFVGGAGDAGGERIGGTTFLAGRGIPRINCISHWTNKPKRRFSSSTAIEVLGQKVCSSELIYMIQLLLDLALVKLGRPSVCQLVYMSLHSGLHRLHTPHL
eukprot:g16725.t1